MTPRETLQRYTAEQMREMAATFDLWVGGIRAASDGGNKGIQCVKCGEWDHEHEADCIVLTYRSTADMLRQAADLDAREQALREKVGEALDLLYADNGWDAACRLLAEIAGRSTVKDDVLVEAKSVSIGGLALGPEQPFSVDLTGPQTRQGRRWPR